jgi:hypothetical protein
MMPDMIDQSAFSEWMVRPQAQDPHWLRAARDVDQNHSKVKDFQRKVSEAGRATYTLAWGTRRLDIGGGHRALVLDEHADS